MDDELDNELWYIFFDRRLAQLCDRQMASREHIAALQTQVAVCQQRAAACEECAVDLLEEVAQTEQRVGIRAPREA